ncbi:hypothetical protein B0H19DRAFT_1071787 [Mycena capillaripes]|nr:hypothetical protein B0H19DRAFT_1071787 [Mycena capillaripes]
MPPEKFLHSMIGYDLAYQTSLCGMVMTQGIQRKVVNIGHGVKHLAVEPRGITVHTYVESMAHKLPKVEMQCIGPELGDEVSPRASTGVALSLTSRVTARSDGHLLQGWEFRIFCASLGVARKDVLVEEHYQCVCAFFADRRRARSYGTMAHGTSVQFVNIDQIVKMIPKLSA